MDCIGGLKSSDECIIDSFVEVKMFVVGCYTEHLIFWEIDDVIDYITTET